jgi:hypothetical protein
LYSYYSKAVFSGEDSDEEGYNEEQAKLEYYLTNGYMVKSDAIELQAPTPYLDEVTVNSQTVVKVDPNWLTKKFGGDWAYSRIRKYCHSIVNWCRSHYCT